MKYLRLKKKKDFQKILKAGKRAHGGSVTIVYMPSARTRMAVCVGKKYGKSVKRNRIKRLLREAFRRYAPSIVPCDILLIPKVSQKYSFASFERDLGSLFGKENLFHD